VLVSPRSAVDFGTVCQLTQGSTDGINEMHKDEEVSLLVSAFAVTGHELPFFSFRMPAEVLVYIVPPRLSCPATDSRSSISTDLHCAFLKPPSVKCICL
jgi:hypothetical protein